MMQQHIKKILLDEQEISIAAFSLYSMNSKPAEPDLQFRESGSSLLPLTQVTICESLAPTLPNMNPLKGQM